MDIVKNGGGQSVHKTLKLVVFEKGINVIKLIFLHAIRNSGKLIVASIILGRKQ